MVLGSTFRAAETWNKVVKHVLSKITDIVLSTSFLPSQNDDSDETHAANTWITWYTSALTRNIAQYPRGCSIEISAETGAQIDGLCRSFDGHQNRIQYCCFGSYLKVSSPLCRIEQIWWMETMGNHQIESMQGSGTLVMRSRFGYEISAISCIYRSGKVQWTPKQSLVDPQHSSYSQ